LLVVVALTPVLIALAEEAEAEPEIGVKPPGPEREVWPYPVCQGGRLWIVVELPPQRPGGV